MFEKDKPYFIGDDKKEWIFDKETENYYIFTQYLKNGCSQSYCIDKKQHALYSIPLILSVGKSVVLKIEKLVTETYYDDGSIETETIALNAMMDVENRETVIDFER